MTDELEILKSDWKKRHTELPKLSYNEIYKMLFKKSTTIVKWIFIISIAELLFWGALSLLTPKSTYEILEVLKLSKYLWITNIIHYTIFIGFIVLFFKNYSAISVTDNTKQLMANILKVRKTVRYFVIYNVAAFILLTTILNIFYFTHSDLLFEYLSKTVVIENKDAFMNAFLLLQIGVSLVMIVLIMLFYRIVYGILLKRLKKNYDELAKIEV